MSKKRLLIFAIILITIIVILIAGFLIANARKESFFQDETLCIKRVEEGKDFIGDSHREISVDELDEVEVEDFGWKKGCLMSYLLSCSEEGEEFSMVRITMKKYDENNIVDAFDYFQEKAESLFYVSEKRNLNVGNTSFSFLYEFESGNTADEISFVRDDNFVKIYGMGPKADYDKLQSIAKEIDARLRFPHRLIYQ